MKTNIIGISKKGPVRSENQDCFVIDESLISDEFKQSNYTANFIAVFDGVGGLEAGQTASYSAANSLKNIINSRDIIGSLVSTNKELLNLKMDFGTTVAGIVFDDQTTHVFNMGDSRVYRYRYGMLVQLTSDHSYLNLIKNVSNKINIEDFQEKNNIITSYLSKVDLDVNTDIYYKKTEFDVLENDIFILATDGITDLISDEEMLAILKLADSSLEEKHQLICNHVLSKGAHDNYTLIMYEVNFDAK